MEIQDLQDAITLKIHPFTYTFFGIEPEQTPFFRKMQLVTKNVNCNIKECKQHQR